MSILDLQAYQLAHGVEVKHGLNLETPITNKPVEFRPLFPVF